jgi:micrococcal nuclease|tara:strand:- start:576 stop:1007 length:432 start_codon:yes stop_codon:yes gene_type:complete
VHEYRVKVVKVVDGDTIDVDFDLGFGVWLKKQRIRLLGIDTPESRTRDLDEKKYGLMAKAYLKNKIETASHVVLKTSNKDSRGKFGRILGEVFVPGVGTEWPDELINVNQDMINKHHAVAYFGQSKEDIAEEHITNRTKIKIN